MTLNIRIFFIFIAIIFSNSCGIYTFTGAVVDGKTINVYFIENSARLVAPSLSPTLTEKVRNKILNQTSLNQVNSSNPDYTLKGNIVAYDVTVAAAQNLQTASLNRLTIAVEFDFVNNIDNKKSFKKTVTKFGDFAGTQTLQQAEPILIEQISKEIADVIFNDAFVNW